MDKTTLTYRDYARFARMDAQAIERDCIVQTFHATGPGGQGVNTADSAVRMRQIPTGITVTSREQRTQLLNRRRCIEKLRERFLAGSLPPKQRHPTKPTKGSVERRLKGKQTRGKIKALRRRPMPDD